MSRFKQFVRNPANVYASILAIVGLLLVFLVPPFQSPDEQTHLYRAYQLSEGGITAKRLSYGAGDTLPVSLTNTFNQYYYLIFHPEKKVNSELLASSISTPLDAGRKAETRFENTANYPPLAYLPQIIGIWVGKLFSAGPIALLYLVRLMNLVAWIGILWLAMKRTPRAALGVFAFALVPIVVFQASSASADVVTTAIAIFFSLEVFRLATSQSVITRKNIYLLICLSIILALCKFPYVLLTLLVLIIPASKFVSRKESWKTKVLTTLPAITFSGLWLIAAQRSFVNLRAGTDSSAQIHSIITSPLGYLHTLFTTYVTTDSDLLYIQMIGQLGWLDTKLPFWGLLCAVGALCLAIIAIPNDRNETPLKPQQNFIVASLLGILVLAISTLLYLTWNSPGAPLIDGLQGRYYLPLFGLILILASSILRVTHKQFKNIRLAVYVLAGLSVTSTLVTILFRYYAI